MSDAWDVLTEDIGPDGLWTRVNISEAMPGVPTPLTWSWFGPASDAGITRAWNLMGVYPANREVPQPLPRNRTAAIYRGRPVLNLDVLRRVGDCIPGSAGDKVERSLFSSEADIEPGRPLRGRYAVVAAKMPPALRRYGRELAAAVPDTAAWCGQAHADLAAGTADPMRLLIESQERYSRLTTHQSFVSFGLSALYEVVGELCRRHHMSDRFAALTTSVETTPELQTVLDLWDLAHGQLDLDEYLARNGFHCPVQGELSVPSWRMDPEPVHRLAKSYERRGPDEHPSVMQERRRAEHDEVERELLARVRGPARPVVRRILAGLRRNVPRREMARLQFQLYTDVARVAAHRVGALRFDDPGDVHYLTIDEVRAGVTDPDLIAARRTRRSEYEGLELPMRFRGMVEPTPVARRATDTTTLTGLPGSRGVATGRARVIDEPDDSEDLDDGEILVCETTNPSWASYFLVAGGVVVDIGGPLSHGPIVAREMGIPCVVNTRDARHLIKTGDLIRVDGTAGAVEILERTEERR